MKTLHDFIYTLLAFPRAWRFMWRHRLWEGLRQYGWVARGLLFLGVGVVLYAISEGIDWFDSHTDDPLYSVMIGYDSLPVRWVTALYESLSDGVLNWATLVLLEVVIYHFMRRTLRIILARETQNAHTFRPFLDAQVRMLVVSTAALAVQSVLYGLAGAVVGWSGVLEWTVTVLIQATLMGFVIADNYNEQFGLTIEQSCRHLYRDYGGVCLGLGLPLLLMLQVPLVGTVLGPLATSVTAAIVLRERSDLHIVGYQMNEKERKKADKKAAKATRKAERKAAKAARRAARRSPRLFR